LKRQKFSLDSLQFVDCLPERLGWFISVRHDPTTYALKALPVGPLPLTVGKRTAVLGVNLSRHAGHSIRSESTRRIWSGEMEKPHFDQTVLSDARTFGEIDFLFAGHRIYLGA
jgi:hypothetical protein